MKGIKLAIVFLALLACVPSVADEGMWMIQDINEALEKNMKARGLKLSAREIYNSDAPGTSVADAVVSIGFYCTGSLISGKGLLLTNHHCAYSNVAKLSTPEHNYLETGFWAMTADQEIPVEGEAAYFLKRVFDVTDEVKAVQKEFEDRNEKAGSRKVTAVLEKRYEESTGLTCILSSMWSGEKYYMSVYKVYTDIRLVAVPPLCIGYFGGEADNWNWPRQNCDFAMYRIYEDGKPITHEKSLKVSLQGYVPGSFTMVIGYPGRTDRYSSSAEVNYQEKVELPLSNELRAGQIQVIKKWMDADPEVRMKYSERFFGLNNLQGNNVGKAACYKRFRVKDGKIARERRLQGWIDAAPNRQQLWGTLLQDLEEAYSQTAGVERDKLIFRETVFRGTYISRYLLRAGNSKTVEDAKESLRSGLRETDPRVEKELLESALKEYFTNLDDYYYGPFQRKVQDRFGYDFKAMSEYLWDRSLVSSPVKIEGVGSVEEVLDDPLRKFLVDAPMAVFNDREGHLDKRNRANGLEREYKRALYWMRLHDRELQYPDANSTMRISYGRVGGYSPKDGIWHHWYSTPAGILQKYDPSDHGYDLDSRQKALLERGYWGRWGFPVGGKRHGMIVDFLTDNDITGGNSGSPVLNDRGELIGLAFDGNIESLASDASYTEYYNMCINTDIRFVMWVLDRYAGMKRLFREIEFC